MKKAVRISLILCICALLAAVCGLFAGCNVDYEAVYNDDNEIIRYDGNYTATGRVRNVHNHSSNISCMSFSGVDTLYNSFDVSAGGSMDLTLNYTGEAGKIKVVLADKDNVYVLKEAGWLDGGEVRGGYSGTVVFDGIPYGKYKLKIVGYKAEFNLQINF